ncbi:hypothetical protein J4731_17215 [Providencia rettgeri]|nr:hypothetical protein [Providencia rettgeri]
MTALWARHRFYFVPRFLSILSWRLVMFSKDPKKTTIDPVSIVKDEAVNEVKNKSKVNELVSSKVQKRQH